MSKLIDVIFKDIKKEKNIYISLIIVLIIALLFGMFFLTIVDEQNKLLITDHINTYFDSIKNGSFKYSIYNNIVNNNLTNFLLWILGFSVIGLPLIITMLFYKGFSLSFTITTLIYNFRLKGIFLSFMYIFPHLILNMLIYFIVACYSFKLCLNMILIVFNKSKFSSVFFKKYVFILIISIILLSLSALYETFVLPYLIKIIY